MPCGGARRAHHSDRYPHAIEPSWRATPPHSPLDDLRLGVSLFRQRAPYGSFVCPHARNTGGCRRVQRYRQSMRLIWTGVVQVQMNIGDKIRISRICTGCSSSELRTSRCFRRRSSPTQLRHHSTCRCPFCTMMSRSPASLLEEELGSSSNLEIGAWRAARLWGVAQPIGARRWVDQSHREYLGEFFPVADPLMRR